MGFIKPLLILGALCMLLINRTPILTIFSLSFNIIQNDWSCVLWQATNVFFFTMSFTGNMDELVLDRLLDAIHLEVFQIRDKRIGAKGSFFYFFAVSITLCAN